MLRRDAGFTLAELMVGLTVIGVMAAIAIPNLASYNAGQKLREATSEIEVAMRRARSSATTQRAQTRVSLNIAAGTLMVQRDSDADDIFETTLISKPMPKGVGIQAAEFGGATTVVFNTRGVPSSGGSVVLHGTGDRRLEVRIAAGSGAVTVVEPEEAEEGN